MRSYGETEERTCICSMPVGNLQYFWNFKGWRQFVPVCFGVVVVVVLVVVFLYLNHKNLTLADNRFARNSLNRI
jgi:peptidoglycan/LPS O-acetylase OafA/YrhL